MLHGPPGEGLEPAAQPLVTAEGPPALVGARGGEKGWRLGQHGKVGGPRPAQLWFPLNLGGWLQAALGWVSPAGSLNVPISRVKEQWPRACLILHGTPVPTVAESVLLLHLPSHHNAVSESLCDTVPTLWDSEKEEVGMGEEETMGGCGGESQGTEGSPGPRICLPTGAICPQEVAAALSSGELNDTQVEKSGRRRT